MIDCQARETVLGLWNTYNNKLIKQGFNAFDLNFTRQLSGKISWIAGFQPHTSLKSGSGTLLINHVPETMKLNTKPVREILEEGISIITKQADRIAQLGNDIRSLNGDIEIQGYNDFFNNQYDEWSERKISMRHILKVQEGISLMTALHKEKKQQFNEKKKQAKQIKDNLPIQGFYELCGILLNTLIFSKKKEICTEIDIKLNTLCNEQEKLHRLCREMMEILVEYNRNRNRWVSILMKDPGQASGN